MSLFDLLPEEERNKIWGYICNYGGYEAGGITPSVDLKYLLRFWNESKEYLYKFFGNNLILEKKIDIECPESILWEEMETMMYGSGEMIEFVSNYIDWYERAFYQTNYAIYLNLQSFISLEALSSNVYEKESFEIAVPGKAHPLQVNKGCKVMKMLAKFAKEFNIEGFEDFRIRHSRILNQKRFKGTLCLSIHPLDYMTMSDNGYTWDSCMSWQKPGEYRIGTVEMMNSEYVIVAYLKGDHDFPIFGKETWNNKRWRELFVVSPKMITHIKGYPYKDRILEREVFNWLLELAAQNSNETYDVENPIEICNYGSATYKGITMQVNFRYKLMYDDFYGKHTAYVNPTIIDYLQQTSNIFRLELSGMTECMECGTAFPEDFHDFDTESLICPDCSGQARCEECGDITDTEDMMELADGTYMCRWCMENYSRNCDCCEDAYHINSLTSVYMVHNDEFCDWDNIHLCNSCLCGTAIRAEIGDIDYVKHPRSSYRNIYQVNTRNFSDEGFRMFGFFGKDIVKLRQELSE